MATLSNTDNHHQLAIEIQDLRRNVSCLPCNNREEWLTKVNVQEQIGEKMEKREEILERLRINEIAQRHNERHACPNTNR